MLNYHFSLKVTFTITITFTIFGSYFFGSYFLEVSFWKLLLLLRFLEAADSKFGVRNVWGGQTFSKEPGSLSDFSGQEKITEITEVLTLPFKT